MFFPYCDLSEKIVIFFHANAEDAGLNDDFVHALKETMKMHILTVEYPGYGIYQGQPNEWKMCDDAVKVFDYLVNDLKIDNKNIFIMGRSMGSGPGIYLASKRNPGALILISPYSSIREVVRNMVGGLLSGLVKERFKNIERIGQVRAPTLFIHGEKDKLVPCKHSVELNKRCKNGKLV